MRPGDRELVARDPSLPALGVVLDPGELTTRLRASWVHDGPRPEHVGLTYLRYKPGEQLVGAAASRVAGATRIDLLVSAASATAVKRTKLLAHARRHDVEPLAMDDDLLLLPYAADRRLPGLRRLERRVGWLAPSLRGASLHPLAYKPHRRLVARVDVDGEPVAIAKVHQPTRVDAAIAALTWAGSDRAAGLPLPRLIAADRATGLVLSTWRAGAALDEEPPERRRATLRAVGKLLGRLHRRSSDGLAVQPSPSDDTLVAAITRLRPDLGPPASVSLRAGLTPGQPTAPVHGDLSPDQVVHGPDGVGLIDLDRSGRGCPADDLASWVAATVLTDPNASLQLPAALFEGYRSVDGPAGSTEVVARLPRQLLRRATDPFRTGDPAWSEQMTRIVTVAERAHASLEHA